MTESQKALSQFIAFVNKHAPNKVDEITSAISVMKKLVNKTVPMKPLDVREHWDSGAMYQFICPTCNYKRIKGLHEYSLQKVNRCDKCDQTLDWSES